MFCEPLESFPDSRIQARLANPRDMDAMLGAVIDGAADAGEQSGFGERLFQEVDLAGEGAVGVKDRLGVAGHVQHGQGWADGAYPRGDLVAEHLGHNDIGE
jgi:hypothetical protein